MKKERFQAGHRFIVVIILATIGLFTIGISEHNLSFDFPLNQNTQIVSLLFLGVIILAVRSQQTTYLEIQDERNLINRGYHDFGKDILDIHDIKYIFRVPQFPLAWFGGSLMVIYSTDNTGELRHSALRERNYSEETLVKFLRRIKEIKTSIELDPEYIAFLDGKIVLRDASENTVASVEERLKAKGESWK